MGLVNSTEQAVDALRSGFTGDPAGLRQFALALVLERTESSAGLWYQFGEVSGTIMPVAWLETGFSGDPIDRWVRTGLSWQHADPRAPDPSWLGRFRVQRLCTPDPERTYYPTPFFRQVVAPARIDDQLRMLVEDRGELVSWIGAIRLVGEPHFTRADQRRLAPLTPPIADALVAAHREQHASPEEACDLVLTPTGEVELASLSAAGFTEGERARAELVAWVRAVEHGQPAPAILIGRRVRWTRLYRPGRVRYLLQLDPIEPLRLDPVTRLSAAQRAVAELVRDGYANAQIAARLGMGDSTVRSHLRAAFERLGVSSRTELAAVLRRAPRSAPYAKPGA